MGLFYKKTDAGTHAPLYTMSSSKTVVIVGLGNIGKDYVNTRHNIGFACVDYFAQQQGFDPWTLKKDLKCHFTSGNLAGTRIILVKPTTLMNLSGDAVQSVLHFYKLSVADILVVHDELDIDFGKIRTSTGGSAAGHNGIKSVIGVLGEGFGRVRVGIGPKTPVRMDSADFVLAAFSKEQQAQLATIVKDVASIISDFSASGSLYVETRLVLDMSTDA